MADGTGDPKNGEMGPTGPKRNPLKQAAPANAREYYSSKVLGVSNRKTKSPTRSPSVEPTELSHPPDENTQAHISTVKPQAPQHPTEVTSDRPTTPTHTTRPTTDTTPCAKRIRSQSVNYADEVNFTDAEMLDIHKAIATAAECSIDYIKVKEHLDRVLLDVEDIMMNQVSDEFQLSNWVTKVVNTFKLKICSKNEWDCFSNHYN